MNKNSPFPNSVVSSSPTKHIYITSIGKLLQHDVSCHVKKNQKKLIFQKKTPALPKLLFKIFSNRQQMAFHRIVQITQTKTNSSNKVFLPQAILVNDIQAIKTFKQKLTTTQVDKYISLHLPVKRPKIIGTERSLAKQPIIQKDKDLDSTCLNDRQKSLYCSKSTDKTRLGEKLKSSEIRMFEYDASRSRSRVSASKVKRDIIYITYTETVLDLKSQQTKKIIRNECRTSQVKVKEFEADEFQQITEKGERENVLKHKNNRYDYIVENNAYSSQTAQSPYIGQKRKKAQKNVKFFGGDQFLNIEIKK